MRSPPRSRAGRTTRPWSRSIICSPDKDLAQCVRDERVVLLDRRRRLTYDEAGVIAKWGVRAGVDPGPAGARRRRRRRLPGAARLGRQVGRGRPSPLWLARGDPDPGRATGTCRCGARWRWPPRSASAATRSCSTGRWPGCGPTRRCPRRPLEELRWRGAPRARWEAFCDEIGLARLRSRPHRWRDGPDGGRDLPAGQPGGRTSSRSADGGPAARPRRRTSGCRGRGRTTGRRRHRSPSRRPVRRSARRRPRPRPTGRGSGRTRRTARSRRRPGRARTIRAGG